MDPRMDPLGSVQPNVSGQVREGWFTEPGLTRNGK